MNALKKIVLCLALLLMGCSQTVTEQNNPMPTFQAQVLNEDLLVNGLEGAEGLISVNTSECNDCAEVQVGDIVEITYDGTIAESYPAQVNALSMKVIEEAEAALMIDNWFYQGEDEMTLTFFNYTDKPIYLLAIPVLEIWEEEGFVPTETQIAGCGVRDIVEDEYTITLPLTEMFPDLNDGHYRISFNISKDEEGSTGFDVSAEFDYQKAF